MVEQAGLAELLPAVRRAAHTFAPDQTSSSPSAHSRERRSRSPLSDAGRRGGTAAAAAARGLWEGSLADVLSEWPRRARTPHRQRQPPPPHPPPPLPGVAVSTGHRVRATIDDWGGSGLDTVLSSGRAAAAAHAAPARADSPAEEAASRDLELQQAIALSLLQPPSPPAPPHGPMRAHEARGEQPAPPRARRRAEQPHAPRRALGEVPPPPQPPSLAAEAMAYLEATSNLELDYEALLELHERENVGRGCDQRTDAWRSISHQLRSVRPTAAARAECNQCSVCLEGFEPGDESRYMKPARHVCQLPCKHLFHRDCITEWLRRAADGGSKRACCPNCRFDLLDHRIA